MPITSEPGKANVGAMAAGYFGNGYHCAEAVAAAVLEAGGEDPCEATAHATAFGGGVGRTHQATCGALSGALIVIGHYHGRRRPGGEWDCPARLGAEIRKRFLDQYGTDHCQRLRHRFGEARQMAECRNLTRWVAATLCEMLAQTPVPFASAAPCCQRPPGGRIYTNGG